MYRWAFLTYSPRRAVGSSSRYLPRANSATASTLACRDKVAAKARADPFRAAPMKSFAAFVTVATQGQVTALAESMDAVIAAKQAIAANIMRTVGLKVPNGPTLGDQPVDCVGP